VNIRCDGVISVAANKVPGAIKALVDAIFASDLEKAKARLDEEFQKLGLINLCGLGLRFFGSNCIYEKTTLFWGGLFFSNVSNMRSAGFLSSNLSNRYAV